MGETTATHEDRIRECAYYLWEAEGCPAGRDAEFWHRASTQIANDGASGIPAKRNPRRKATQSAPRARARSRSDSTSIVSGAATPVTL